MCRTITRASALLVDLGLIAARAPRRIAYLQLPPWPAGHAAPHPPRYEDAHRAAGYPRRSKRVTVAEALERTTTPETPPRRRNTRIEAGARHRQMPLPTDDLLRQTTRWRWPSTASCARAGPADFRGYLVAGLRRLPPDFRDAQPRAPTTVAPAYYRARSANRIRGWLTEPTTESYALVSSRSIAQDACDDHLVCLVNLGERPTHGKKDPLV